MSFAPRLYLLFTLCAHAQAFFGRHNHAVKEQKKNSQTSWTQLDSMIHKAESKEKSTKGEDLGVLLERGQEKVLDDLGEETIAQKKKKRLEEYYREKKEEDQKAVRDKQMAQILQKYQAEEKAKTHAPEKVEEVKALLQAKKEREEASRKRREEALKALKAREEEENRKIKEMEIVAKMLENKENNPEKLQELEALVKKMKDEEESSKQREEPDYIAPEAFDDEEEVKQEQQESASKSPEGPKQDTGIPLKDPNEDAPLTMIPKELQEAQDEQAPKDLQAPADEDVRRFTKEALEKMSKEDEAEKYRSTQFSRLKKQNMQAKEDANWNKAKDLFVKKGKEDDEENLPEGSTDPVETTELSMAVGPDADVKRRKWDIPEDMEEDEAPLTMKGMETLADGKAAEADTGVKKRRDGRFGGSAKGIGEEITRSGVAREDLRNLPLPDLKYDPPVSTFDPDAFCNEDCQAGMEALFLLFIAAFTGAGLLARVKPIAEELLVQAGLAEARIIVPKSTVRNFDNGDLSFKPTAKFEIPRDALANAPTTTVSQAVLEAKKRTEEELRKMKEEQDELARKVAELKRQEERAILREQRAIQLCPASKVDQADDLKDEVDAPKKLEPKGADASTMALLGSEIDLMDAIMSMDDEDM